MPYEDDYKMWLEKALIRMNPDWVCDEMSNNEFAHNWCHQYCGEEDAYITPKCLHMYYHHIARADCKTEQTEPQTDIHDLTDCDFCNDRNCKDCEGGKDEPQTERSE